MARRPARAGRRAAAGPPGRAARDSSPTEEERSRGAGFRAFMYAVMAVLVVGLLGAKVYGEFGLAPAEVNTCVGGDSSDPLCFDSDRKERVREEKRRRREAYEQAEAKLSSGDCDEDCRRNLQAVQASYSEISTVVETDYYEVLGVASTWSKKDIRKRFEKLREQIRAGESGADIDEVNEAYGVLMNNEARMYYNLYGRRLPDSQKHNTRITVHGGWAQELATRTHNVKKMLAWLNYFDSTALDLLAVAVYLFLPFALTLFNIRPLLHQLKEVYPDM
eukprot:TRINITY_DN1304_c2_g1_i2.p1 TRINITY_DN1304_c2_g1~~TRINITY_DN1304_c2_g1_i2.p1  ORF type:complete len:302 (+),score=109.20 TRINITY_DN1304_c2_g1_i2:78-908(+)